MKKVLVTGGCGFIGSNLVDRLVSEGYDVNVLDNLSADSDQFYFNEKRGLLFSLVFSFVAVFQL
mgnify:CR=1 FL=1